MGELQPKTITIVDPASRVAKVSFKNNKQFKAYLKQEHIQVLVLVAEAIGPETKRDAFTFAEDFNDLVDGGVYWLTVPKDDIPSTHETTKTVNIVLLEPLQDKGPLIIETRFANDQAFQKYLKNNHSGQLLHVDESKSPHVAKGILDFEDLQDGELYWIGELPDKPTIKAMRQQLTHLAQRREEELTEALITFAKDHHKNQNFTSQPDLRVLHDVDGKSMEIDSVVFGDDVAYLGSHKTYTEGIRPVEEIADRANRIYQLSRASDVENMQISKFSKFREIRPAFMAEWIPTTRQQMIQKACLQRHVILFRRNGSAISPMAATALRFV